MFFNRNKNKNKNPPPSPPPCNHKWKDFPWYINSTLFDNGKFLIEIIEPYVCIYCKKQKNIVLKKITRSNITRSGANEFICELEEKYKDYIKDKAIVNDMINDMILVDREYLRLYEEVVNNKRKDTDV